MKKNLKKHNLQFVSNRTVTLKTSDNIDPEPGYKHAQFERFRFNGVREKKPTLKDFFLSKRENTSII